MANPEHLDILKKGVEAWNMWRAELRGDHLHGANFTKPDLSGADLRGANLRMAHLIEANLSKTDLSNAVLDITVFGDVDLTDAKGLRACKHRGPSTVGIDTIYRSNGRIPEEFLRGAGVPDNFITFMKSLTGAALEFYSCFISYSTTDQAFAERLYADLQAKGVRCWFAPHDVQSGKKLHEQIDEAIRVHDKLLLLLSTASMNSEWVKTEIAKARKRELRENRRMLFPLGLVNYKTLSDWECFDADTGKDTAREIREYFIPDFSQWKDHDSYQHAFERLLRDLKAAAAAKS
jgi:hypothetical protein